MKNIWKNVLGVALIAAISSGAAIGTSTYLMNKNQRPAELASGVENTFKQPYRLTNYGTVAAVQCGDREDIHESQNDGKEGCHIPELVPVPGSGEDAA